MKRLVLIGALFAGACGATDDRPRTLAYITETILAPSCASAECHSAFKRAVGDQFDTLDATRESIVVNGLVVYPADVADPTGSLLFRTVTVGGPSVLEPGSGNVRMPYDAPMPDADVELIRAWIEEGAKGAQCLANAQGRGCSTRRVGQTVIFQVVECSADGNINGVVMECPQGQFCQISSGNGQCVGS
jgi:hypothetical protein